MSLLTESPRHTTIRANPDEAVSYRSVPGVGGAHVGRRIDVSSAAQIAVSISAIRPQRSGTEHIAVGRFILGRGTPLIWPVPHEALGDDLLVVIECRDTGPADVIVMDHWRV